MHTYYPFTDTLNAEKFASLIQLTDSNYLAVGASTDQFTYIYSWLAKIDNQGKMVKQIKLYDTTVFKDGSQFSDIIQTYDGNFMISQVLINVAGNAKNVAMVKMNTTLDTIWTKIYSTYVGSSHTVSDACIESFDKGILAVGTCWNHLIVNSSDFYMLKTDSLGNKLWDTAYGGNDYDAAWDVVQTPDSGFLVIGITRSFGAGNLDNYLIKIDKDGKKIWQKTYGTWFSEGPTQIFRLYDDNYLIVAGGTKGPGLYDDSDGTLIKINSSGTKIWQKDYGRPVLNDELWGAVEMPDSGIIAAGVMWVDTFNNHSAFAWVIKTDKDGNQLWEHVYNILSPTVIQDNYVFGIIKTNDGGVLLNGFATDTLSNSISKQDGFLLKLDSFGCNDSLCALSATYQENYFNTIQEFGVYPNPVQQQINIAMSAGLTKLHEPINIQIMDVTGRIVYSNRYTAPPTNIITIENVYVYKGIYLIKLKTQDYENTKLFIKQ
nr:T9SS type A sorting domain-containing protein [Bacteroidota bacterium]